MCDKIAMGLLVLLCILVPGALVVTLLYLAVRTVWRWYRA